MEDLQARLIAPCATFVTEGEQAIPDIPALFRRLLLFETYILQTIRFKEFVPLVRTLGVDNVLRLLQSGALKLELDPTLISQSGQTANFPAIREKPPLPFLSFAFSLMRAANYNEYLVRNLQDVRRELYGFVSQAGLMKLEGAILKAMLPMPEDSGVAAIRGHETDLRGNSPVLKKALAMKLRRERGLEVPESELVLRMIPIDATDYRAECNLDRLGMDTEEAHKILESALLAVGGLNRRLEEMRSYNALSGAIDDELPLFAGKFDFLTATLSPGAQQRAFDRAIRVCELPTFELNPPDRSFDMERFLEVRSSKECVEFREWLRQMRSASDEEITEQLHSLRARLGPIVHGTTARVVRIVISTVIDALSTVLGAAVSILDSFVVEKIFPVKGPILFLSRKYRSLFEKDRVINYTDEGCGHWPVRLP